MNENQNNMIPEKSEVKHIFAQADSDHLAKIKIVGVGGAGGNAVNRMVKMNIKGVEYISINTDALALDNNLADEKIAIGMQTTKNLGAGAKPEIGRQALMEDKDIVEKKIEGADMLFISAGLGGGTGTGAAPVVAEISRKLGILTVAVVTMPFQWEGVIRRRNAEKGLAALRKCVDSIIVINNQRILDVVEKTTSIQDAFLKVDEVLGNAVRSICDIMFIHGTINVDFNDARTIMSNGGSALMGTGTASGEGRALKAAQEAIHCQLLDNVSLKGASGALINVSHGENFSMMEYGEALSFLYEQIGENNDPNIIAGDVVIPELGDRVSITVIATGFDKRPADDIEDVPAEATQNATVRQTVKATPRRFDGLDFVAAAGIAEMPTVAMPKVAEEPRQPIQKKEEFSSTARIPVIKPVEEPREEAQEEAQNENRPFFNSNFNAARPVGNEEEVSVNTTKMSSTASLMLDNEESLSIESDSRYGIPTFLKNASISEQDF